jgi:hypothetical protein
VDDDDVLALAAVDQGEDRGIAHIAAIPIVFAISLPFMFQVVEVVAEYAPGDLLSVTSTATSIKRVQSSSRLERECRSTSRSCGYFVV